MAGRREAKLYKKIPWSGCVPIVSAIKSWMPGQTADADQEQRNLPEIRSIRPIRVPQNEEAHQAAFVRPDAVSSAIRNSDGVH